jgi:hypothetical protein
MGAPKNRQDPTNAEATHGCTDDGMVPPQTSLGWGQALLSGLAAAVGIQNSASRERDFSRGSAIQFVIAGVVLTGLFITTLLLIVALLTP